jgi:hypothetical protein
MKASPRYLVVSVAFVVIAVVYGQPSANPELRMSRLQEAFDQLLRAPRSTEQVSPAQDKLLEKIVDEVIYLHRENIALKKEIENLKTKR